MFFLLILMGFVLFGFAMYLGSLYFQLNAMHQRLDDSLKDMEVYLLKEFGEVSSDEILREKGIRTGRDYEDDEED